MDSYFGWLMIGYSLGCLAGFAAGYIVYFVGKLYGSIH